MKYDIIEVDITDSTSPVILIKECRKSGWELYSVRVINGRTYAKLVREGDNAQAFCENK